MRAQNMSSRSRMAGREPSAAGTSIGDGARPTSPSRSRVATSRSKLSRYESGSFSRSSRRLKTSVNHACPSPSGGMSEGSRSAHMTTKCGRSIVASASTTCCASSSFASSATIPSAIECPIARTLGENRVLVAALIESVRSPRRSALDPAASTIASTDPARSTAASAISSMRRPLSFISSQTSGITPPANVAANVNAAPEGPSPVARASTPAAPAWVAASRTTIPSTDFLAPLFSMSSACHVHHVDGALS